MNVSFVRLLIAPAVLAAWLVNAPVAWAVSEQRLLVRTPALVTTMAFAPPTARWLKRKARIKVAIWGLARPPMYMGYDTDAFEGLTADILCIVQTALGVPLQILKYDSREQAIEAVARGEVDILAFNNVNDKTSPLLLPSITYLPNRQVLLRRSRDSADLNPTFAHERLAYIGTAGVSATRLQERYPQATLIPFNNHLSALTALAYDQVDGVRSGSLTAEYLMARFYPNDVHIVGAADPHSKADLNFAVSASQPLLLEAVNHVLATTPMAEILRITSSWGLNEDIVLASKPLELTPQQQAWIAKHPTPTVLVGAGELPLSFYDEHGQLQGLSIDLLRMIERFTGLRFKLERTDSIAEMINRLQRREADAAASLIISNRYLAPDQFTRPYLISPMVVVTRRTDAQIKSLEELRGKRLALTERMPLADWAQMTYPSITLVPVNNVTQGLEMLSANEVDSTVSPLFSAKYFINQHSQDDLHVASVFGPSPAWIAMAVNQDNLVLRDIINQVFLQISPHALKDMTDRWRNHAPPAVASPWATYRSSVYSISLFALIFGLAFLVWNYYLQRQIKNRKKAQAELKNQLAFSRTLIDGSPVALYVRDHHGRLVHCNQAYLDFVNTPRETLQGKTLLDSEHMTPEVAAYYHGVYMKVLKEGQSVLLDGNVEINGQTARLYHWILPFQDTAGAPAGVIGGWLDISEREQLMMELEQAKERAVEANESKSVFLASMSHEIRTPISALIGLIELLRKHKVSPEQQEQNLKVAHQTAQSLLSLVGDILDLSKIEGGAMVASPQPSHLPQLIESAYHLFENNAAKKQLDYKMAVDVEHPMVLIDALLLNQIVSNLLSNAVKFTERGWILIHLRELSTPQAENTYAYELEVSDSGVGLTASEQRTIFDPFVQAGGAARSAGGTGLGLSICTRLAQLLNGALSVHSQKGAGSRFVFRFEAAACHAYPSSSSAEPRVNSNHRLKVLVVDDNAPNRMLLCQQLEYLGHQAVACTNGDEALRLWIPASPRFDLTITDCNMPDMDGYELAQELRELEYENAYAQHPIFGLTANAQQEIVERCLAAGMTRCLFKPMGVDTLQEVLGPLASDAERKKLAAQADSELERIRLLKPQAYTPLIMQLLQSNAEAKEQVNDALQLRDGKTLSRLAHKIKGTAQLANDKALIAACHVLEDEAMQFTQDELHTRTNTMLACMAALEVRLAPDNDVC